MDRKFTLTGPFAEELMNEVDENVKCRKYTDEELNDSVKPLEYDYVYDSSFNRNILNELINIDYKLPVYGKGLKLIIKKILLKLFSWYLFPVLEIQNNKYKSIVMSLEHVIDEIEYLHKYIDYIKTGSSNKI